MRPCGRANPLKRRLLVLTLSCVAEAIRRADGSCDSFCILQGDVYQRGVARLDDKNARVDEHKGCREWSKAVAFSRRVQGHPNQIEQTCAREGHSNQTQLRSPNPTDDMSTLSSDLHTAPGCSASRRWGFVDKREFKSSLPTALGASPRVEPQRRRC
eukprot:5301713-Prymnesium_polylepis.2